MEHLNIPARWCQRRASTKPELPSPLACNYPLSLVSLGTTWGAQASTPPGHKQGAAPHSCQDGIRRGLVESQDFHQCPAVMGPPPPQCQWRLCGQMKLPQLSSRNEELFPSGVSGVQVGKLGYFHLSAQTLKYSIPYCDSWGFFQEMIQFFSCQMCVFVVFPIIFLMSSRSLVAIISGSLGSGQVSK